MGKRFVLCKFAPEHVISLLFLDQHHSLEVDEFENLFVQIFSIFQKIRNFCYHRVHLLLPDFVITHAIRK